MPSFTTRPKGALARTAGEAGICWAFVAVAVQLDYAPAGVAVREDLRQAHARFLRHLASPGSWWSGAERLAIAAESRNALGCRLCLERKEALSPASLQGEHESLGALPASLVDVIHRVRTDSGRLSRSWFDGVLESGLDEGSYVEAIGVVTMLAGVDCFARALGLPPFPLPEPLPGEPSRQRPTSARPGTAWVAMIAPEDADGPERDLYGEADFVPNIVRALSLVPDHVRVLRELSSAHYMGFAEIPDFSRRGALDRMQMELVAARVSSLNECFY